MGLVVLASAVDLWPSFASGMATPTSGPFQIIHLWTVVAKYVVSEHCDIAIGHIHRTYRAHHPSSIIEMLHHTGEKDRPIKTLKLAFGAHNGAKRSVEIRSKGHCQCDHSTTQEALLWCCGPLESQTGAEANKSDRISSAATVRTPGALCSNLPKTTPTNNTRQWPLLQEGFQSAVQSHHQSHPRHRHCQHEWLNGSGTAPTRATPQPSYHNHFAMSQTW